MRFGLARAVKWRIVYTVDGGDSQEFLRVFYKQSTLHEWMAQNENCTIQRMSIMYEYDKDFVPCPQL